MPAGPTRQEPGGPPQAVEVPLEDPSAEDGPYTKAGRASIDAGLVSIEE